MFTDRNKMRKLVEREAGVQRRVSTFGETKHRLVIARKGRTDTLFHLGHT